ncbi:hypothetical protein BHE74_00019944 [Ensete ventricosum]|nr:hypothetical protein BHE74_00019944 [Ensete ventricosum]
MVINFREVASRVEFRSVFRAPSRKFKILANPNILAHVALGGEFRSIFYAPSRKFKILVIPDVWLWEVVQHAHGMSYEHDLMKKRDVHKLFAKVEFRSIFHAPSQKFKIQAIPDVLGHVTLRVEFRPIFHAPSRKFKILAIHDVLAHGKSYKHDFMKKRDGYKLCTKSRFEWSFDRFFVHRLENSKYWPSRHISPWEVV